VLVVEDNLQNRYLVTYLLEKHGITVLSAANGEQAIDMARRETPDLILMDMLIPKVDGYEATRIIKADAALAATPVVALTAYSMKGDEERIAECGCDGYIAKPIDPGNFIDLIARYIRVPGS
jgi:two-component system cell cycle response regulator DivK